MTNLVKIGDIYYKFSDIEEETMEETVSVEDYIEENREELRAYILDVCNNNPYIYTSDEDEEIEEWILNDEYLYNQARRAGVDI